MVKDGYTKVIQSSAQENAEETTCVLRLRWQINNLH